MLNAYGQSNPNDLARLLAQHQQQPIRSPLEAGLRALAVGIQANNQREYRSGQEADLVSALEAMNREKLTAEGPVASGGVMEPQQLAKLAMNPATSELARVMFERQYGQQKPEYMNVGGRLVQVGPGGVQEVYAAPEKPDYKTVGNTMLEIGPGGPKPVYTAPEKPLSPQQQAFANLSPEQQAAYFTKPQTTITNVLNPPLEKSTKGAVEKGMIDVGAQLQRISAIEKSFNPKFLQLEGRVKNWAADMMDRAGIDLDPDTRAELMAFTQNRQDIASNTNATIKELTGAAVTEAEAPRLMAEMPTERDGPTAFQSKLGNVIRKLKLAMARLNYIRGRGLEMSAVPLDQMEGVMGKRANELIKELRGQYQDDAALGAAVKEKLAAEFGLALGN